MQSGRKYTIYQSLNWTKKYIFIFLVFDSVVVLAYQLLNLEWLISLPWQPISLIGIALAFYLGFKNNSSYERLWEARKIWGGIVNTSRSFTVLLRDYINNEEASTKLKSDELLKMQRSFVDRHIAWLHALVIQLRKQMPWEHNSKHDRDFREYVKSNYDETQFNKLKEYLPEEEFAYIMGKGNKASHLLSLQSSKLMEQKFNGYLEHFRQLECQNHIKELFTLQGKAERIKNFPFPRQYASATYYFIYIFLILLPFGMLNVFSSMENGNLIWLAIPFSVVCSWVFWFMEMIGDYSENPFEGLYNDVPISTMATSIEIDILQMLEETNLPEPVQPVGDMKIML